MEEKTGGKRLSAASDRKKIPVPAIVAGVLAVAAVAGYLGLCAVAGGDKVWPNTFVRGNVFSAGDAVDVSGLTLDQAVERVSTDLPQQWAGEAIHFIRLVNNNTAKDTVATLPADDLMEVDTGAMKAAITKDQNGAFLTRGGKYLARLAGSAQYLSAPLTYTQNGAGLIEETISSITQTLGTAGNATTWTVDDTAVSFTKGRTGAQVNEEALRNGVRMVLNGLGLTNEIDVSVTEAPPAEPDYEAIRDQVYSEPADAYLDLESKEIVPSVEGRDLDVEAARLALAATAEGNQCTVPLETLEPEVTTEELNETLFSDVLGQAVTWVSGTWVRVGNVKNAIVYVNGTILAPGEEFSYNRLASPFSVERGYGLAPAYVDGKSIDTSGGGVCQGSTTIYVAALKANLQIVERWAHGYEPAYVAGGLDATVVGGGADFRFINSTENPIKIEGYVDDNRYLHVTIYGNDTTGIHGEPYSTGRVVYQPAKTVYEPNEDTPQGTIVKDPERTPYNGVTIDTYQKLVDADGNVVSEYKLYTTKYAVRDQVMFYNPADAELWGIDPETGIRTEPVVAPAESPLPAEETPPVSEEPGVSETGEPTESADPVPPPEVSADPVPPPAVETEPPAESGTPAGSDPEVPASEPPAVSEDPAPSGESEPGGMMIPGSLTAGD